MGAEAILFAVHGKCFSGPPQNAILFCVGGPEVKDRRDIFLRGIAGV